MKLCVLGGGGVRSCFLAKSIACNAHLADLTEVVLMDVDQAKLDRYGKLARQIAIRIAPELKVTLTTQVEESCHRCRLRDHDHPFRRRSQPCPG